MYLLTPKLQRFELNGSAVRTAVCFCTKYFMGINSLQESTCGVCELEKKRLYLQ